MQKTHYEERIRTEPKWTLVGIFADKGITGTSMKKRDEFNKMLRLCYKGKIDMIIVKSISRFARIPYQKQKGISIGYGWYKSIVILIESRWIFSIHDK